jgi:DNA repair exonuclease SbcCD nuclease subunit
MLRLLQTSDLHLGARHLELGAAGAGLRERGFVALERIAALAVAEKVHLVLIAGDLFATNTESERTVKRVAAAIAPLAAAGIRTVVLPGDHDPGDRSSIHLAHDLAALAGAPQGHDLVTVLLPDVAGRAEVTFADLGAVVTSRLPATHLADDGWRIGVVHGATRPRDDEIAGAAVDLLAIGGLHTATNGRAGSVSWGASGAPEVVDPVDAVDGAPLGSVLLVTLDDTSGQPEATFEHRPVGLVRGAQLQIDASTISDPADLEAWIVALANPDLILTVTLTGDWPDELEPDVEGVRERSAGRFLHLALQNAARPALTGPATAPPDTIAGAFVRDLEARIAEHEAAGRAGPADELREALRLGRRLLLGQNGKAGAR